MIDQVNKIIADRGLSGVIPVLAVVGVATVGFYSVIAIDKIIKVSKGG